LIDRETTMNAWTTWQLLAKTHSFWEVGDFFWTRGAGGSLKTAGLVTAAAAALFLMMLMIIRWIGARSARKIDDPRQLLAELCRAHRLSPFQRQLVTRIARQAGLAHPATVFVEPGVLESAMEAVRDPRAKRAIAALKGKLFGE
jgi:hypothetical protein